MHSIPVRHSRGSYEFLIGPGLSAEAGTRIRALLPGRRLAVVTDATIRAALSAKGCWPVVEGEMIEVPAGEAAKSREEWGRVTDRLVAAGIGRDGAIVAIGGGSVGDLAGFVAATYLRGIPFVQIPTTLLAMVDASVGGKVGIDTAQGKNLVGAFHPPALVLTDPRFLGSLPDATYREGLAEAVKHGVIADAAYFAEIEGKTDLLTKRDGQTLKALVHRSVEIKAGVVARDEHESGERAILNAGHTIAHALELVSGYTLRHGEAVAIGLVAECRIGERMGVTEQGTSERVAKVLGALGLPTTVDPRLATRDIIAAMSTDKKNRSDGIRMALPAAIGRMARAGDQWTLTVDPALHLI